MRIFNQSLLFITLLIGTAAQSEPVDIHVDSPYCTASNQKYPQLQNILTPAWKKNSQETFLESKAHPLTAENLRLRQAMSQPLAELGIVTSELNSRYLNSIRESLYVRLVSATAAGLNIGKYEKPLADVSARCNAPDFSGETYKTEALHLQSMVNEIQTDYGTLNLHPLGQDLYLRKLVIAILESRRLERVINFLNKRKDKDLTLTDHRAVEASLAENERRLLRLHFSYPVLKDILAYSTQEAVEKEFIGKSYRFMSTATIFFTSADLETWLDLAPEGQVAATLKPIPLAPVVAPKDAAFNDQLYKNILSGKTKIPFYLKESLLLGIDRSIRAALKSAELKCANSTPCSALAVEPDLASRWIDKIGKNESLGPLACACRINEQQTTINTYANVAIGVASASAVVAAMTKPKFVPLVISAYVLSFMDMATAVAGVYDGAVNFDRNDQVISLREGGSTSALQEEQSRQEIASINYNLLYDIGTGAVGIIPPGRITGAFAHQHLRALLRSGDFMKVSGTEFAKALSGAPALDLKFGDYANSWNPRRLMVPLPPSARTQYPLLMKHLQEVAALGEFADDSKDRYELLYELKRAAEQMSFSGSASDLELLSQGLIRADLCSSAKAKSLSFVK
jgi:hypothetical protein